MRTATSKCEVYGQVIRFKRRISGVTVALQWLYSGSRMKERQTKDEE
ncbi:hypothetical protein OL230_00225 [Capnocytophaga ochracea]|nr:hypothetical protein [Capnocytophaga ochracea]UZD38624.1 hypothetical protein OL230_00225 [Capnocytophaga ochracea]